MEKASQDKAVADKPEEVKKPTLLDGIDDGQAVPAGEENPFKTPGSANRAETDENDSMSPVIE